MKKHSRLATLSALSLAVAAQLGLPNSAFARSDPVSGKDRLVGIKWTPGRVSAAGEIIEGNNFDVTRNDTGDYTVVFPAGAFPKSPPVMTCNAAGADSQITICNVWATKWDPRSPATVEIRMFGLDGSPQDNAFNFSAIMPPKPK